MLELRIGFTSEIIYLNSDKYSFCFNGRKLELPAYFINTEKESWLKKRSVFKYQMVKEEFSGFSFYHFKPESKTSLEDFRYDIDIIGSLFILLSRYEELVLPEDCFDKFGRFKPFSAINFSALDVPISDELIAFFKIILETELEYSSEVRQSTFKILPSHDVDRPFKYLYYSKAHLLKRTGGDIFRRGSFSTARKRWKLYRKITQGDLKADPYNTFDWIMKQSEKNGLNSTFHFIAKSTHPKFDQDYNIGNDEIQKLLIDIYQRGHQIGLHPSFRSSEIPNQLKREMQHLKEVCGSLGIHQSKFKSRYHYLRWNNESIDELEKAEVDIDQTLGYAQKPGFKSGTCHSYSAFNFTEMRTSSLTIEPLIVMEVSLFSPSYLNLNNHFSDAWDIVSNLKDQCRKQGGNLTLLWHNNYLNTQEMKEFYCNCIQ